MGESTKSTQNSHVKRSVLAIIVVKFATTEGGLEVACDQLRRQSWSLAFI